jgi:ribosomal protein S18 acetylase RimI-like enzyme
MADKRVSVELVEGGWDDSLKPLASHSSRSNADFETELSKPHCRLWLARLDAGAPVAFLLAWVAADELQIVDLATAAHARRQGAARALLETVRHYAIDRGFRCLVLEVRANNKAALALYLGVGFEPARRRAMYYADGEDALELVLEL